MRLFTRLTFASTILTVTILYGCRSNEAEPKLPQDHFLIQENRSVVSLNGLTIKADTIWVSICPTNASCFAPNSASVRLTISKNTQSRSVSLFAFIPNYGRPHYANAPVDSTSVEFDNQLYKVILRDGNYLGVGERKSISRAVIQVSPL